MDFIIKNWFKYYTKETCRALGLVATGTALVVTIVCIKYKPAYKVTLAGEYLGVVESKEIVKTDDLELTNSDITLDDIIEKENDIIQSKELKKQFEILNFKLLNMIILVIILIVVITILFVIIRIKIKKDKNNINENKNEIEDDKKQ